MDRVFLYRRVQSDVRDRESGVVFNVVLPVSYLPGAGYFWKYRVPMKELPQLLLSRTDVPNTGSGMVLLGRHRAGARPSSRALGKLASGSQKRVPDLQMVCGGWRSRAALISAAHPSARELIEPFPNTAPPLLAGPRRRRRTPRGSGGRSTHFAARLWPAAVQERSVPRPPLRHRIGRRGRVKQPLTPSTTRRGQARPAKGQPRQEELA